MGILIALFPDITLCRILGLDILAQKPAKILGKRDTLRVRSFFRCFQNFGIKTHLNIHCIRFS